MSINVDLMTSASDRIITRSGLGLLVSIGGWPTLAEVKNFLNVTDSTHDAYISRIRGASLTAIEMYLDRKLEYKEETETILLTNCDKVSHLYRRVYLHRWPIDSVLSIVDENGKAITFKIDEQGLLCGSFQSSYKVIVDYVGGFNPIPFDILTVFYEMINSLYAQKGVVASTAGALKSEAVPGVFSRSYYNSDSSSGVSQSGMGVINPINYAFILDPYKAYYV